MRARTDDTHIADKNVNELWEFIQVSAAQEFTNFCDPHIILGGLPFISRRIYIHAAEFEAGKRFIVLSAPRLYKKDGSPGLQPD